MLDVSFTPFPVLNSARLHLRAVDEKDWLEIIELRGDVENMRYIPRPLVRTKEDALAHLKSIQDKINNNEGIDWAITLKGNPKLLGIIGHYRIKPEHFRSEIGYMILPTHHNQGIATEAIQTVLKYGFEQMSLHAIEAIIDPRNSASEKVLQKNGFVKEAHLIENHYFDGQFFDSAIYTILKRNFKPL